jgi:hypothetical protein
MEEGRMNVLAILLQPLLYLLGDNNTACERNTKLSINIQQKSTFFFQDITLLGLQNPPSSHQPSFFQDDLYNHLQGMMCNQSR